MIDTIVLTIQKDVYRITDLKKFRASREELLNPSTGFKKYPNNPSPKGPYGPKLTLNKRNTLEGLQYPLRIEFSAPKIVLGNNLDELAGSDLSRVITGLLNRMASMGVSTSETAIADASVSAFHPSKNIQLSDWYTASFAIKELAKIDLSEKLDLERTSFRNGGYALQYYSRVHSFVWYDKISDLPKPAKRAIDKDQTRQQRKLFEEIRKRKEPLEILRMEVRLTDKRKIKAVLSELGEPGNPTFRDVFKKDLCQKVLQHYWETMVAEKNMALFDSASSASHAFETLMADSARNPRRAAYLTGLALITREAGVRPFRETLKAHQMERYWSKMAQDMREVDIPGLKRHPHGFVRDIERALADFTPYRLFRKPKINPLVDKY